MKIRTVFLARCQEIVGRREGTFEVDENARVGDVLSCLVKKHPELKLTHLVLNDKYNPPMGEKLADGDTLCFFSLMVVGNWEDVDEL